MSVRHAPLGVDIGAGRVRIALGVRAGAGVRVRAVAAGDLPSVCVGADGAAQPELVAAVVEDLVAQLGMSQRRCVLSLGIADAQVRFVRFPKMSPGECRRAAQFEAERFTPWDGSVRTVVRVHRSAADASLHVVGMARRDAMTLKTACARRAGLRAVVVDSDAMAYRRAFPSHDAVLDIGYTSARLHVYSGVQPYSTEMIGGGSAITQAVATDLSLDFVGAEKRKRFLGTAGAGQDAIDEFVSRVARAVASARERTVIRRIALVGNGVRLAGLAETLERSVDVTAEIAVSHLFDNDAYPNDVVRAAAPDWTLAAALAAWSSS